MALGPWDEVAIPGGAKILEGGGTAVLAGFWNCHVHFTEPHWEGADSLPVGRLTQLLRNMLNRYGFTHVLDTGSRLSNTLALRGRIESGGTLGPDVLTTGPGFVPPKASPFYILPAKLPQLDSPQKARDSIRARLNAGTDAIKLFTGSWASPTSVVPMPVEIVQATTSTAHGQDRLTLAHASNNQGLEAALKGGVDILAHTTPDGGHWKKGTAEAVVRAGMALIPTLKLWNFELQRRGQDSTVIARFLAVATGQLHDFVKAGGQVLFGTDVGYMTDYDPTDEYVLMQQAGMSFRQILASLTTAPAERFEAGGRGRLEIGAVADITVVEGDPAADIRTLAAVRYTLREGRLIYSRE
jgi:imidazolonepropionase-like amidohydrolase